MNANFIIELVTPKQSSPDLDGALERFGRRYRDILAHGFVVSIPDNPMGTLRFRATEMIKELNLPMPEEQVLIHLNTFHTRRDLDEMLEISLSLGFRYLLVVSGDGNERLPKLSPEAVGFSGNTVTAVELLSYIHTHYPNRFSCGVAFNPYEPLDHEMAKLERKIQAGAEFVITQPVIERHKSVDALAEARIPVFVGVWMSPRLEMLSDCVGYPLLSQSHSYDAVENALRVRARYAGRGTYFCAVRPETQLTSIAEISAEKESKAQEPAGNTNIFLLHK